MPSLSINRTIPLLIVSPILASVVVTGYFGYFNGRKAVDNLAQKINLQTTRAIEAYVQEFLGDPHELLAFNDAYIEGSDFDVKNFDTLRKIFVQLVPSMSNGVGYGSEQGQYMGIFLDPTNYKDLEFWLRDESTGSDANVYQIQPGQPDRLLKTIPYDPRVRPWYKNAVETGKTVWSEIYVFAGSGVLGMTAAFPIYDENKVLQGVFSNDIILNDINKFLEELYISPKGEAFIIERNGSLVGNSLGESPFIVIDGEQERLDVRDSVHPLLKKVSQAVFERVDNQTLSLDEETYFKLTADRTSQYIGVMPIKDGRGIDWLIVVAIPEADFSSVILASVRSTLIVGGTIAILSTIMGLLAAKWIITPIQSLNWAAKAIEEDRFEPATLTKVIKRQDEVGELAQVFQNMATVVGASKANLKQQMSELENEVLQAKRKSNDRRRYDPTTIRDLLKRSRAMRDRFNPSQSNGHGRSLSEQLKQVKYFASFSEQNLQKLIALGGKQILQKNEILFHEDDLGESFYLILQGSVKIYIEKLDKFLTNLSGGDFFGELSLLLGIPRTATVQTLEETSLFVLDRKGFQLFLQEYPDIGQEIAQQLCEHQEELEERKQLLKAAGLLEDEESFNSNPLNWIRKRIFSFQS
ncbi:cyclic nucleotide-binding domain-containing protein [Spirulina sp. 06S082]|uniref:cyclic nucleotide-binding domain-containing protein n=1 Tax=Spirulina sp. 06S082 TaxID=3110248 RepID=UPI002B20AAEB|nr:cyclic nucleotide-binding domain-containing protein [Spirulina sp. 06S082]MEA5469653.1 cyclic nucleotide-binding domain-containing protein [Spirulina sp. 06S082]